MKLHYEEEGEGDTVFIFLHGFGDFLYSWKKLMEKMSGVGTLFAYDRMGYGFSERKRLGRGERVKDNPYSKKAQAKRLCKIIDKFTDKRIVLVGHSAGTTIALLAALEKADRVKGMVLISPSTYVEERYHHNILKIFRYTPLYQLGFFAFKAFLVLAGLFKKQIIGYATHSKSLPIDYLDEYSEILRQKDWDRSIWELALAMNTYGILKDLDKVKVPVLLIHGDHDKFVPLKNCEKLANLFPNSKMRVIASCGHIPLVDQFDDVYSHIREFAEQLAVSK